MTDRLPEGWTEEQVGEVLTLVNGFAFKPAHWGKRGLPIIRIQNLNNADAPFNYFEGKLPDRARVRRDDLLFAWSGTPGTSFGAHIWTGGDAWLNQHIFRVGFDQRLFDRTFLRHAINQNLSRYISEAHGGAGLAHITKGKFESSTIFIAPLSEQKRIVERLERLLAEVERCKERMARIPVLLKRFRQSVLAAACSGRLTADLRETHRVGREESSNDDDLPLGWRSVAVGDVIDDLRYGTSTKCSPQPSGTAVLRIPNIGNGIIDHSELKYARLPEAERKKLALIPGDVLMIRSNGSVSLVGKTAVVGDREKGFAYAGYLIRLRVKPDVILPMFLHFCFANGDFRRQIEITARSTSGVNNINSEEVRQLKLFLPPIEEQEEIVQRATRLLALADRIEERYQAAKKQVDGLPQSILAKAFRGALVPTEAALAARTGRTYESAAQLLERIHSANPRPGSSRKKR